MKENGEKFSEIYCICVLRYDISVFIDVSCYRASIIRIYQTQVSDIV